MKENRARTSVRPVFFACSRGALALKDVRLALAEAEQAAVPMPSLSVVRDRLIAGIARGYADLDWTALGLIAAEEAGLQASLPRGIN